jgi:predicted LPLAT superfamily acyltransferase
VLASLLACPLLMLGCVREGAGHVVRFELLAEQLQLPRAGREQALQHWTSVFAQRLEALLVRAPYDWFNFFLFWNTAETPASAADARRIAA